MMSWQARVLKVIMRYQMAGALKSEDPPIRRAKIQKMAGSPKLPPDVVCQPVSVNGVPAEWIATPNARKERAILHMHGGGYYTGSLDTHREFASRLARAAGMPALLIAYRLVPEHPFPASLEDCTRAYRWLLSEGFSPARIIVSGDSSGGGLALAALVELRDRGVPLPAGAVVLSPWTDLALTGETIHSKAKVDPANTPAVLAYGAALYAGENDPKTPLISPQYADLHGLPPLLIQVGTEETLLDDSIRLAERARSAGCHVTLEVWPGMIHNFHLAARYLPEARKSIEGIGAFICQRTESET